MTDAGERAREILKWCRANPSHQPHYSTVEMARVLEAVADLESAPTSGGLTSADAMRGVAEIVAERDRHAKTITALETANAELRAELSTSRQLSGGIIAAMLDAGAPDFRSTDPAAYMRTLKAEVERLKETWTSPEEQDESDTWIHKQLDELGVPTSQAYPGKAYDGFIARVKDHVTRLRAATSAEAGKVVEAARYYLSVCEFFGQEPLRATIALRQALAEYDKNAHA